MICVLVLFRTTQNRSFPRPTHRFESCNIGPHVREEIRRMADERKCDYHRKGVREIIAAQTDGAQVELRVFWPEEHKSDPAPRVDHAHGHLEEAEQEEGFVVVVAHAVSDPRAVVVHFEHAFVAHRTMVRSLRLPIVAVQTHLRLILDLFHGDFPRLRVGTG